MTGKQKNLEAAAGVSQTGSARPGLILGGILVGAFILRTVGANQVFSAVEMPVTSLMAGFRLTLAPWLGGDALLENFFVQLVLFYRGVSAPLILYIDLSLLRLFGIRISEFILVLPFILAGLLGVAAIYALGKRFFGVRAGLLAALFMGLASWHVANSRTPQSLVVVFLIQVLVFLAVDKLIETRARRWAIWSALALALEVMSNNGFPFTLLVVAFFFVARARREGGDWKGRLGEVVRESGFRYWAMIPILAVLFQGVVFILAMGRNELLGLLAWSNQHSRYFFDVGPSVIIHEAGTPLTQRMFGSILNIGIGLNVLFALTCLVSLVLHIPRLLRFDTAGVMVFWYGVLGLPQIFFFYTYPEIAATNIAVPLCLLGAKLMSELWERRRAWGIALVMLAAVDGLSGALYTNLFLPTPNWGLYIRAEAENARGASRGFRGIKSAAYFVRARTPKDDTVYVNLYGEASELYFNRQLCQCGGRGKKALYRNAEDQGNRGIDWFIEYNPWMDARGRTLGRSEYEKWIRRTTRLNDGPGHLAAVGRDGETVLWKVFSRKPAETENLQHGPLVSRFNREYMSPDRFFTNRLGGMTFWMN